MTHVYYRIDDRLIHGQVATRWANYYYLKQIIIADDEVANNPMQKQVISMTAPSNIKVKISTINESANEIIDAEKNEVNTLVLIKGPKSLVELHKNNVSMQEIIIGGMQFKEDTTKVTNTVYISKQQKELFKELSNEEIKLIYQVIPDDKRMDFNKLLDKA